MKYVILRCEDDAPPGAQTQALLEGAKVSHLHHVAHVGAGGRCLAGNGVERPARSAARAGRGAAIDRFHVHRALLGLTRDHPDGWAGRCYAESAKLCLKPGETVWCCELVTQHEGKISDPAAGGIPTKEGELLIRALDEHLGSERRRWVVGQGAHHLCIVRDRDLAANRHRPVPSPELLVGEVWSRHLPMGRQGEALAALLAQGATVLEGHPVNRVRLDLGENPANMLWFWGASDAGPQRTFTERTGLSGAIVSSHFVTQGLAGALGLEWAVGPSALDGRALRRVAHALPPLLARHDLVYVHLRVETGDPVERLCAMERLDQLLLAPLTEALPRFGSWRLLVAVDDRTRGTVPFVAIGTALPRQPIVSLTAEGFAASPLVFRDGTGWFDWLTAS